MLEALLERLQSELTGDDVDLLARVVRDVYAKMQAAEAAMLDPEEFRVADYLSDPVEQRIAQRAVSERPIAKSVRNARLLHSVAVGLERFYEAELKPLPASR